MANTFPMIIAFAFMATMLLVGTWLRAKIPLFQRALVPASLLGGAVGFILISLGLSLGFDADTFAPFTFHFFTLSFMSLVLIGGNKGTTNKTIVEGGIWLTLIWTMSLVLQAIVGFGVIAGYNQLTGDSISTFLGAMVTFGYTQGPGQALTFGTIWENAYGISNAATIGLIYASLGFLTAFVVGVPVARWAIRHGYNQNATAKIDDAFLRGIYDRNSNVSAGRQVTHSANVDSLAWHFVFLGVAYIVTHYFLLFMQGLIGDSRPFGIAIGVLFSHGLFFLWGLIVCVIIRAVIDWLDLAYLIDDETQKRITGASVDFMMVGTLMSIQFSILSTFLVPVLLVSAAVTVATALLCFGFGRHLGNLGIERALTIFGCCCGSTGTGLLLLRILDPDYSTSVAKELAFYNVAILFAAFHVAIVMSPILPDISAVTIGVVFVATFLVCWGLIVALGLARGRHGFKPERA